VVQRAASGSTAGGIRLPWTAGQAVEKELGIPLEENDMPDIVVYKSVRQHRLVRAPMTVGTMNPAAPGRGKMLIRASMSLFVLALLLPVVARGQDA
jgi:hypothetical protein